MARPSSGIVRTILGKRFGSGCFAAASVMEDLSRGAVLTTRARRLRVDANRTKPRALPDERTNIERRSESSASPNACGIDTLTPGAVIAKWRGSELKERSTSQEHLIDLCRLLGEPKPAESDPADAWSS